MLAKYPNDVVIAEKMLGEVKVQSAHLDAKGARYISIDLDWLDGVRANAQKHKFEQAALFVRPKGSQRILAVLDLDTLLDLLAAAT